MKLLTLNTHSLVDKHAQLQIPVLTEAIQREHPDIIALQEVNQAHHGKVVSSHPFFNPVSRVCDDNFLLNLLKSLNAHNIFYHSVWHNIKLGYDMYDEGIALLSKVPITALEKIPLTKRDDYNSWKTRHAIGIKAFDEWFYCVHFGRWEDEEEAFSHQWSALYKQIHNKSKVWLLGDFNNGDNEKNKGYNMVRNAGFYDCFRLFDSNSPGFTATCKTAGWEDTPKNQRIDYIFCSYPPRIKSAETVFDGINQKIISDHFGVIIETE